MESAILELIIVFLIFNFGLFGWAFSIWLAKKIVDSFYSSSNCIKHEQKDKKENEKRTETKE